MTPIDIFVTCNIVCIWLCLIWLFYKLFRKPDLVVQHLKDNTSPNLLDEDFEKSALYVEHMLAEKRKTAVREDQSGPNAVVHRPRQIGPMPQGPKYFGR